MPLSYVVSEADNLVRVSVTGAVTSDDLPGMTSSILGDRSIVRGMQICVEAANVEPDLTFTDLRTAAGALQVLSDNGISDVAIVTDTTHLYALAQVFAVFAPTSDIAVKVFRDHDEASAWLRTRGEVS